jgi:CRP/FNR family nitrogen fixation transcriptional regulator
MNANRAGLQIREPGWTHERAASPRPIPQALESLSTVSRYQRDDEIYPQQGSVECWYRVISGAARRFALRADGRRQTVDLLLPGDFFGFGVRPVPLHLCQRGVGGGHRPGRVRERERGRGPGVRAGVCRILCDGGRVI